MTENKELSLLEAFDLRVKEQQEYVDKLAEQSKRLLAERIISPLTMQYLNKATDNLEAIRIAQSKGDMYDVVYFFSRACANTGEFVARVSIAKKAV